MSMSEVDASLVVRDSDFHRIKAILSDNIDTEIDLSFKFRSSIRFIMSLLHPVSVPMI